MIELSSTKRKSAKNLNQKKKKKKTRKQNSCEKKDQKKWKHTGIKNDRRNQQDIRIPQRKRGTKVITGGRERNFNPTK